VSSSRDFGVKQFFRADEFRADDPSPSDTFQYADQLLDLICRLVHINSLVVVSLPFEEEQKLALNTFENYMDFVQI
jgi:hypothetical protein